MSDIYSASLCVFVIMSVQQDVVENKFSDINAVDSGDMLQLHSSEM